MGADSPNRRGFTTRIEWDGENLLAMPGLRWCYPRSPAKPPDLTFSPSYTTSPRPGQVCSCYDSPPDPYGPPCESIMHIQLLTGTATGALEVSLPKRVEFEPGYPKRIGSCWHLLSSLAFALALLTLPLSTTEGCAQIEPAPESWIRTRGLHDIVVHGAAFLGRDVVKEVICHGGQNRFGFNGAGALDGISHTAFSVLERPIVARLLSVLTLAHVEVAVGLPITALEHRYAGDEW